MDVYIVEEDYALYVVCAHSDAEAIDVIMNEVYDYATEAEDIAYYRSRFKKVEKINLSDNTSRLIAQYSG